MTNCVTASFTFVCCRIVTINKRNDVSSCRRAENWKWKVGNKFPSPPSPFPSSPQLLSSFFLPSPFFSSSLHSYTLLPRFYQFPPTPFVALFFCTAIFRTLPQFLFNFVLLIELIRSIFLDYGNSIDLFFQLWIILRDSSVLFLYLGKELVKRKEKLRKLFKIIDRDKLKWYLEFSRTIKFCILLLVYRSRYKQNNEFVWSNSSFIETKKTFLVFSCNNLIINKITKLI